MPENWFETLQEASEAKPGLKKQVIFYVLRLRAEQWSSAPVAADQSIYVIKMSSDKDMNGYFEPQHRPICQIWDH